ncbi:MAG: hypoxanthine phosphoribosyltransferase [Thermoanaerobaculia bacterium]
MGYRISEVVLDEKAVRDGVSRLARAIDRDLGGKPVLLVGVLKGSVFFLCDLARQIHSPVSLDFLRASSYGARTRSSGRVRVADRGSVDPEGRDVILVEDIVDTGRTVEKTLELLRARKPRSLKVCALLRKRKRAAMAVSIDYLGFDIDDRFVVGYGLDLAEAHRNLPYVAAIEETKGDS